MARRRSTCSKLLMVEVQPQPQTAWKDSGAIGSTKLTCFKSDSFMFETPLVENQLDLLTSCSIPPCGCRLAWTRLNRDLVQKSELLAWLRYFPLEVRLHLKRDLDEFCAQVRALANSITQFRQISRRWTSNFVFSLLPDALLPISFNGPPWINIGIAISLDFERSQ